MITLKDIRMKRVSYLVTFFAIFAMSVEVQAQVGLQTVNLSYPSHMDTIEEQEPTFTWQTSESTIASDPRMTQRFVLCELKPNQTRSEAIQMNMPLIIVSEQEDITLPFPTGNNELEYGKNYVWQVSLIFSGAVIQQSEVSQFTLYKEMNQFNYLPLKPQLNTAAFTISGKVLRVSVSSIKDLELKAEVKTESGEKKTVTMVEIIDGEVKEQTKSMYSNETRFFELDLQEFKIKKGVHVLTWSPVKGENYQLLFERK